MKEKSLPVVALSLLLVLGLGGGIGGLWEEARAEGLKAPGEARLVALAVNPFEIEMTSELGANLGLKFLHHWLGYTEIWNETYDYGTIYVPVDNFITLLGSSLELESLEVCYKVTSGSYINQTRVYYANDAGTRTDLISDETDRSSTDWDCYTVDSPSPKLIEGPMLVYFNLAFPDSGTEHIVTIGRMVLTAAPSRGPD